MIEYLEQLVRDRQYGNALSYAEQLLIERAYSPKDLLIIHTSILTCREEAGDYAGAAVAGETALKLASELEEWDYFGLACLDLGVAYYNLQEFHTAVERWLQFISNLDKYDTARRYQVNVWCNLGEIHLQLQDTANASRYFERALRAATAVQSERFIHGIRLALINSLIKSQSLAPIPRLFAQCRKYISNHPGEFKMRESGLWYLILRAEYALATNRLSKARIMALRSLSVGHGVFECQFSSHMILAEIAQRDGKDGEALAHALSARAYAHHAHQQHLESQAVNFMYGITSRSPTASDELEQEML